MQNLLININELKANNYSRTDDSFEIIVNFNVNEEQLILIKRFKMDKRAEALSQELVNYVKNYVKDKNKPSLTADDFMEAIVVVRYKDVDEIEEKIAGFFRKFNDNIKNYKTKRYTEGFLNKYSTPDGFSMKIK